MATTTAYILSLIRITTGIGFIALPQFTCTTFLVPQASASAAILATRLAGARELAVGELLWYALRRHRTGGANLSSTSTSASASTESNGSASGEQSQLLPGEAATRKGLRGSVEAEAPRRENMVAYALVAGMAIDVIDVLSCLVCLAEGSLPLEPALLVGSIGCAAFGVGAYSYFKGPWKV
ncbi:MAG: hypothetical protein INR71_13115 [Terriglobus roseus]|nr:hypothetical protein [Terriglobus roseus]